MTFNIEYGGTLVDFDKTVDVIRESRADVIGVEEAQGNMVRLAEALGWDHVDPRMHLLSRYPLLDPPEGRGLFTYVEVRPGRVVAVGNVHLPSAPYGPYRLRAGEPRDKVLRIEREVRVAALEQALRPLSGLAERGVPAFLVGDFNSPSHLDWTERTVGMRSHMTTPMGWPVSRTMEEAGFRDSYREIHPDPAADPGLTWPAARPRVEGEWNPGPRAPADRIDFVYAAGRAEAIGSVLLGEAGGAGVDVSMDPWPTDHRAVLSTFVVRPAQAPTLVAVERRVVQPGQNVVVRFHISSGTAERVAIVPAGAPLREAVTARPVAGRSHGAVELPAPGGDPGEHGVLLIGEDDVVLARTSLWLAGPGGPRIDTSRRSYDVGAPIEIRWSGTDGNRWDWLAVYRRGTDPRVASYLLWRYTGSTVDGSAVLDGGADGTWPLEPGPYTVHVLEDDGYETLAQANFAVRP